MATAKCEECDGSGQVDCEYCGAADMQDCSECDGTGEIESTEEENK